METSLRVESPWAGAPVYVRERTFSTMDDARELASRGCPEGTVVVAGFQSKGRGRAPGRTWHAGPWESLLATVVLEARTSGCPATQLPLRAAVAVSLAVEQEGARPRIKWPNDVTVDGRKLAGILCETCEGRLLVGMGVNCLQKAFPPELAPAACSLLQVIGREVTPLSLLPRVLAGLALVIADDRWMERLRARLAFLGQRVSVGDLEGEELGVDAEGRLLLRDGAGAILRVAAGELRTG